MAIKVKVNTTLAQYWMVQTSSPQHAIARALDGRIWLAYVDSNGLAGALLVAYSDDGGVTWTEETVVAAAARASVQFGGLNIMVDSSNVPMIVYEYDPVASNDEIRYVDRSGDAWNAPETVDTIATILWIRAVLDNSDNIHIAWVDDDGIYYLTGSSGAWGAAEKAVDDASATNIDLAVNTSGQPVIAYINSTKVETIHKTATWQTPSTVDTPVTIFSWMRPVIAIDSNGDYHVVWSEEDDPTGDREIYYKKRESGVWQTEQLIATATDGWQVGIALDNSSNAYAVYQHDQNASDEIVYYRRISGGDLMHDVVTLDADILQPQGAESILSCLYHLYPSSGIISVGGSPTVVLLHENGSDADIYYESFSRGGEGSGVIAVVEERLHYVDAYGVERFIQGTVVT